MNNKITELRSETSQQSAAILKQASMEGKLEALARIESTRERMRALANNAQEALEKSIVAASLDAAKKMTLKELSSNSYSIIKLCKHALQAVKEAQQVRVMVHPQYYQFVVNHKKQLLEALDVASYVDIREDALVEPGGAVVHTEVGSIDAQPSTLFAEMTRALLT